MHFLSSFSVDEILLTRYVNSEANPFTVEIVIPLLSLVIPKSPFFEKSRLQHFAYSSVFFIRNVALSKKYVIKFPCLPYFRRYFVKAC